MATTAKRLVVCGGNGFLGSRICKSAVARGWDVTSISRSGEPKWSLVTSSDASPSWARKVSWERANILAPATYTPLLKGVDYVVHSMGILLEADYKGVLSGKESPISGLARAFSSAKSGSQDPLARQNGEELKSQEKDGQFTYELMNRDSAIALAQEANKEQIPAFAYVSAASAPPVVPRRYIDSKRQAETAITEEFPNMRSIFLRPGFMYDPSRKFTMPLAAASGIGSLANKATGGMLAGMFGGAMAFAATKPLLADVVAEAIVEALSNEETKGPVEVPEIEELAEKGWRKGML